MERCTLTEMGLADDEGSKWSGFKYRQWYIIAKKRTHRPNTITPKIELVSPKSETRSAIEYCCCNMECVSTSALVLLSELVLEAGVPWGTADWSSRRLWGTVIWPVAPLWGISWPSASGGAFVSEADCFIRCSLRLAAPIVPATITVGCSSPVATTLVPDGVMSLLFKPLTRNRPCRWSCWWPCW